MTPDPLPVPDADLDDLQARLRSSRWATAVADAPDWSWGTPPAALRRLVDRWTGGYDWRATERRITALSPTRVEVDGVGVHVLHAGTPGRTPLLLVHGWPDSPLRFERAIPLLADRFDLVIPSVPGYGFSDRPAAPGIGPQSVADLFVGAMTALGHERFGVHGGDIGSGIGEQIALRHPDRVIGLHLVDVPFWHRYTVDPASFGADEQAFADAMTSWAANEGAYAALHRTKPQTLAWALDDSPIALAAWMLEKYQAWTDNDGDVIDLLGADAILDQITLYWLTQTGGSSVRYYREMAAQPGDPALRTTVPTGFAIFPKDIPPAPRTYAERFFEVARWTEMPRGGHFGALEQPELFASDVRAFFDQIR